MGFIAREVALDIGASAYRPDVAEDIPGVANKAADALSRPRAPDPPALPPYIFADRICQPIARQSQASL